MHELSIALGIIEVAAEEVERHGGGKVCAVHLRLGALAGLVPEALRSAYELAREGSVLANAELVIEHVPVCCYCPHCGDDKAALSIQELCCSRCGTPTPEIVSGRELQIVALEIEA